MQTGLFSSIAIIPQDDNLPPGWVFRLNKSETKLNIRFVTGCADLVDSLKMARDYIAETEPECLDNFNLFQGDISMKHKFKMKV